MLKMLFTPLILMLFLTIEIKAQCITVSSIKELKNLQDYQVDSLCINFKMKRSFDYTLIPMGLKSLRFLKPSRNLVQAGVLYERITELRIIELYGKMTEFLPEILYGCKQLDTIILTNTKLSHIWNRTALIYPTSVNFLILNNFVIDRKCKMYKGVFIGKYLSIEKIILNSDKEVSAQNQALLMNVFKTKNLWINGVEQNVFPR
jgi:hypothetical protein